MKSRIRLSVLVCILLLSGVAQGQSSERAPRDQVGVRAKPVPESADENPPGSPSEAAPAAVASEASVPRLVKFSGAVKKESGEGQPRPEVMGITFALYQEREGGAPLWMEVQNVRPNRQGQFTVLLGATEAEGLPLELFSSGEARWLGVQVEGEEEQARVLLVSVPYALKAAEAEKLGGKSVSDFVLAEPSRPGPTGTGKEGAQPGKLPPGKLPPKYTITGTANTIPKLTNCALGTCDLVNSVITESSSNIGIGTASPGQKLSVAGTIESTSGGFRFPDGSTQTVAAVGGGGDITEVAAGTGLTGGGTSGDVTLSLLTSCASGQVLKWNGAAWACQNDIDTVSQWVNGGGGSIFYNAGKVGVGTTTPLANLHLDNQNTGGLAVLIRAGNAASDIAARFFQASASPTNDLAQYKFTGAASGAFNFMAGYASTNADGTGGVQQFAIRGDGSGYFLNNLGVGVSFPGRLMEVGTTGVSSNQLRISGAGPNGLEIMDFDGNPGVSLLYRTGSKTFNVEDGNGTSLLTIDRNSGKVGIGTTAPATRLQVAGSLTLSGGGNGILFPDNSFQASAASGDITGVAAGKGLTGGGTSGNVSLSLVTNCTVDQVLKWTGLNWVCATDLIGTGGSGGTVTSVAAGTGLSASPSPITTSGTLSISSIVARRDSTNSFTGDQSVTGNITATSSLISPQLAAGASGSSQALTIKAADGSGNGGALTISAGNAGTTDGGDGGNLTLQAGSALPQGGTGYTNLGPAGVVTIAAGLGYNGVGGNVIIESGLNSNWSLASDGFSKVSLQGGGHLTNDGAVLDVEGAHNPCSDNCLSSVGGNVRVRGGDGNGGLSGGSIVLTPGTGSPDGTVMIQGNASVSGTLTKGGGSFKIDHPLDPAHKYLSHSFVESPDMKNVYDGMVVMDEHGQAWVQLPDYFEALNKDFRYQLTCLGGFAPVYVAQKISGSRFKIAGGRRGLEVSWQVTGTRQDAFARAYRIPVEEEKPAGERGKYLHPELFGQPESPSAEMTTRQIRSQRSED